MYMYTLETAAQAKSCPAFGELLSFSTGIKISKSLLEQGTEDMTQQTVDLNKRTASAISTNRAAYTFFLHFM